jgi:hypothetical protein
MKHIKEHAQIQVAINIKNSFVLRLPMPYRHHHLLHWLGRHCPHKFVGSEVGQGFWYRNQYMNRIQAHDDLVYTEGIEVVLPIYGEKLYSENLWTDVMGPEHSAQRDYYEYHEQHPLIDQLINIEFYKSNDTNS